MRIDRLTTLTLLYLLLPVWLFLLGWVQLPTALPLCLLTAVAGYRYVRKPNVATSPEVPLHRYEIAILLLASLFFTWVSGIGAFTGQLTDYGKHNQIFVDLITRNWPIIYQNPRYNDPFLCYYVAYYLPTAALTKLLHLPLRCADWLSAGWGWAGLWLSLRWAMRLSGPYRVWIGAGLLLLAGIEIPYRLGPWLWVENGGDWSAWWDALWHGPIFRYSRYVPPRYFFNGGQWQHSLSAAPLFDQLQQAPQHAFPGWLGASLLLHRQRSGQAVASLWLVSSVLLLWSPFVAVGLAALVVLRSPTAWRGLWPDKLNLLASLGLTLVLGLYLRAHQPLEYVGWIVTEAWQQPSDALLHIGYFALNYGLPAALLYAACRQLPAARPWLILAGQSALLMALLSAVYIGAYNDFYLRTIIPAQWAFHLSMANGLALLLRSGLQNRRAAWLLTGWILVSTFMPVRLAGFTSWALRFPQNELRSIAHTASLHTDITQLKPGPTDPPADFAAQYVGRRNSWFFTLLIPPDISHGQARQHRRHPK